MSRVRITAKVVREAKFPPALLLKNSAKFIAISDDEVKGFQLRVKRSGAKAFWVKYSLRGKQRYKHITDAIADPDRIEQARSEASRIKIEAGAGRDTVAAAAEAEVKAEVQANRKTIGQLIPEYLTKLRSDVKDGVLRQSSYGETERYLLGHWAPLHDRYPEEIERHEVTGILDAIGIKRGKKGAADRARSALTVFWAFAEKRVRGLNPALLIRLDRYSPGPRKRKLSTDELRTVWDCLQDDEFGQIVRLIILCGGLRPSEIGDLQRDEVRVGVRQLELPGDDGGKELGRRLTKNGQEHVVPLSPQAWEIISDALANTSDASPYLFGRYRTSGFSGWSHSKKHLDKRIAQARTMPTWQLRDLRRTVRTLMAELRIGDADLRKLIQNHKREGVEGVYDKSERSEERREALQKWAGYVEGLMAQARAA